jgi:hypothetical protein
MKRLVKLSPKANRGSPRIYADRNDPRSSAPIRGKIFCFELLRFRFLLHRDFDLAHNVAM